MSRWKSTTAACGFGGGLPREWALPPQMQRKQDMPIVKTILVMTPGDYFTAGRSNAAILIIYQGGLARSIV